MAVTRWASCPAFVRLVNGSSDDCDATADEGACGADRRAVGHQCNDAVAPPAAEALASSLALHDYGLRPTTR